VDQPGDVDPELVIIRHVEPEPCAHAQTWLAVLTAVNATSSHTSGDNGCPQYLLLVHSVR
jgi:hypothetical protein